MDENGEHVMRFVDASPYRQLVEYYRRTGVQPAHTGKNPWMIRQVIQIELREFARKRALDVRRARYADAKKLQQNVEDGVRLLSNNEQLAVAMRSLERKEKPNERN